MVWAPWKWTGNLLCSVAHLGHKTLVSKPATFWAAPAALSPGFCIYTTEKIVPELQKVENKRVLLISTSFSNPSDAFGVAGSQIRGGMPPCLVCKGGWKCCQTRWFYELPKPLPCPGTVFGRVRGSWADPKGRAGLGMESGLITKSLKTVKTLLLVSLGRKERGRDRTVFSS